METIHGFDFQAIQADRDGKVKTGADELAAHVKASQVSDVVLMCHGFRNDANDARSLYSRFLQTFAANQTDPALAPKLAGRTYAVGGMFWPSMILREPNDSDGAAQSIDDTAESRARLVQMKGTVDASVAKKLDEMLALIDRAPADGNAQLDLAALLIDLVGQLKVDDQNEVNAALAHASPAKLRNALTADEVAVTAPGSGAGGAGGIAQLDVDLDGTGQSASFLGNVFGFVPKFVNLTTFLVMFHRCGGVGAEGLSQVVRKVKAAAPTARIHLVGHSLGGRAVTACANALLQAPAVPVDTMTLLQAAYSHFGLSAASTATSAIKHPRGHFRDVIEKKIVKGPILATHSVHDRVVGLAYTPMAAISLNNSMAIGDEHSPFGGIGRNGILDMPETEQRELNVAGVAYSFAAGKVYNLDGSRTINGVPVVAAHGDVTSPAITWAFASAVAAV